MKVLVSLALLCAVGVVLASDQRADVVCPPQEGPLAIHIPDPDDCTSFYTCEEDGNPVKGTCDPGLVFNPDIEVCDWPANVPSCQ